MSSLWKRITTAHVQFVTTGYLRIMEPIAGVLIKLGVSANALTTFGTAATVAGGKKKLKLEETGAAPKSFGSQMFKAVFDLVTD